MTSHGWRFVSAFSFACILIGCNPDGSALVLEVDPSSGKVKVSLPAESGRKDAAKPGSGQSSEPDVIAGRVVRVIDGDTVEVLQATNETVKIRLSGIDTPEKSQPFGTKARQALGDLVAGKVVDVIVRDTDRYNRTIADLYLDGGWVNKWMIEQGWAWHYKQYSKDEKLAQAELVARARHRGLWADPNAVAPWEYRKSRRVASSSSRSTR